MVCRTKPHEAAPGRRRSGGWAGLRASGRLGLSGLALVAATWATAVPSAATVPGARAGAPSHTVWLCRPGQTPDPCTADLASTAVGAGGSTKVEKVRPDTSSKFDCFYVYPTVSAETTENSNLEIQGTEIATAEDQASRFSSVCRVWAPMYRQETVAALFKNDPGASQVAYASLLSGWEDYLAHDNHGRPVIFIGHSQGAAMLIRLLRGKIDPSPKLRKLMVSAIILGGNVTVPVGQDVGGSFTHIPTCRSGRETGCVIAYSSFGTAPPQFSLFGRPGTGVSALSGQTATEGLQVACVNPANFSSGSAPLLPYFLSATSSVPGVKVNTPWVSYPGLYTAQCETLGGATTLQVVPTGVRGDHRPEVTASLCPAWGYHLDDVNLALGNLVHDVGLEEAAYRG
jgi:hypothetical protein